MTALERSETGTGSRAQTSLPALAVALLVVTMVTGIGLAVADGAIGAADRDPGERRVAVSLAAGLVDAESPLTHRANVVDESALARFDDATLRSQFPVTDGTAVRISLAGRSITTTAPGRGTTVRRLVVIENRTEEVLEPALRWQRRVTLPRRGTRASLTLTPPPGTTVRTVRANDRIVLHNDSGLSGSYDLALSRFETTTLRFDANGPLPPGSVRVEYDAIETRKETLVVTIDG